MGIISRFRKRRFDRNFEESYQRNTPLGRETYFKQREDKRKEEGEIARFEREKSLEQRGRFEKTKSGVLNKYAQRFSQRIIPRATPSSQQRFYKSRAKILRGVGAVYPIRTGVKSYSQGRVKYGRGRPKGTFKYFIPGKGQVDVFTWRKYVGAQKQLYRMQIQQQMALQKVANKYLPQQQGYSQEQQIQIPQQQFQQLPQQFQKPQFAGQSVMPVEPQPYKEISVLERTPINLSGITLQPISEQYEEISLMTGQKTIKNRTGGFL